MHNNSFNRKWHLAINVREYIHSSASFYSTDEQGFCPATNFMEMEDGDLNINKQESWEAQRPRHCFRLMKDGAGNKNAHICQHQDYITKFY